MFILFLQTVRLCEMGFPQDQVVAALNANGGNEEAALNALLSGPVSALAGVSGAAGGPAAGPLGASGAVDGSAAPGEPPGKPAKPSGLFGRMWGSK